MFLNVTVKQELASLIAKSIVNPRVLPNKSYVTGEPIAHTFLGHLYEVFNRDGVQFNRDMPALFKEFKDDTPLRICVNLKYRKYEKLMAQLLCYDGSSEL